jgi:hypothetical protein
MSRILIKSAWGSDDPTKAAFAFLHGNALAEKGHEVQMFFLGEAVSVMRESGRAVDCAGGMASPCGSPDEDHCGGNPDSRLKRLREGPWGLGTGSERQECYVRYAEHPGGADRVGGQDPVRVSC